MLKKVSLELGGNNAFIVLDDADLDAAAAAGAFSAFQFQGQVCFAAGRHLVHRSLADAYIAALTEKAKRLRTGDPYREDVQLGPIVNEKQIARVDGIVQRSIAAGAVVNEGATFEGLFYRPTVLTSVTPDMPAFTDEIFGPVAPITVFGDDEEAIALANASSYGLVASIYTRSIVARASRSPTGCGPAWSTSTTGRSTTRRSSRSAAWATPATAAGTAARPASTRSPSGSG